MTLDDLLTPLDGENPCGPDLLESGDYDFDTYTLEVEERLPDKFFDAAGALRVSPASIDIAAETTAAMTLLARSRDLRVLAFLAQFCIRGGDLAGFVGVVKAMADLLERYPDDVHPRLVYDTIDRSNTLEQLTSNASVLMPLEFAPLIEDRRQRGVSFRRVALARGARKPVGSEKAEDANALMNALRSVENAPALERSFDLLNTLVDALKRIDNACLSHDRSPFRPDFEALYARVEELRGLVAEARPDADVGTEGGADADDPTADEAGDAGAAAAPQRQRAINSMAEARAALEAIEKYFAMNEPSALSYLLVRQARQLVGKPLVDAIRLLVPELANRARIDFGTDLGFMMTMEQMRALSDGAGNPGGGGDLPEFTVNSRAEAGALMRVVETYYGETEPSSPIPVLLLRARTALSQSFTAILEEVLPPRRNN